MKLLKTPLVIVLAVWLCASAVFPEASAKPGPAMATGKKTTETPAKPKVISWLPYDQGMAKAKGLNKHVLIDFTASWCGWCKKMEAETFSQPEVIDMVNANFVPIRVWGDSEKELNVDGYKITEKNLAMEEYRVTGYPTFWFLNPKLEKLAPMPGYRDAETFMKVLDYVKERKYDTTYTKSKAGNMQADSGSAAQQSKGSN